MAKLWNKSDGRVAILTGGELKVCNCQQKQRFGGWQSHGTSPTAEWPSPATDPATDPDSGGEEEKTDENGGNRPGEEEETDENRHTNPTEKDAVCPPDPHYQKPNQKQDLKPEPKNQHCLFSQFLSSDTVVPSRHRHY